MADPRDFIQFDEIDKNGPQTYSRSYELTPADLKRDELANVGPVAIEVSAGKGHLPGEYLVDGNASFTADLECSRCVDPYPFASSSTFHLRFRPRPAGSGADDEIEVASEELDVEFYAERAIPLRHLASEQIQLSIPMKPLCTENCLGLCPKCGANRNTASCKCEVAIGDSRLAALHDIRDQIAKKRES